jgi:hypothetical protein
LTLPAGPSNKHPSRSSPNEQGFSSPWLATMNELTSNPYPPSELLDRDVPSTPWITAMAGRTDWKLTYSLPSTQAEITMSSKTATRAAASQLATTSLCWNCIPPFPSLLPY